MAKRIAIIDGHPDPAGGHLCQALAKAYAEGAQSAGHEVRLVVVARLDFPLLRTKEAFEAGAVPPDIEAAQRDILWSEHLCILYPLWLGTMPAVLKGFFEQAMRPDFAFEGGNGRWPKRRLGGRTARIVVTMGMPALLYRWYFLAHSLRSLERNILRFCGIKPVGETIFGLVDTAGAARRAKWLGRMRSLGAKAA